MDWQAAQRKSEGSSRGPGNHQTASKALQGSCELQQDLMHASLKSLRKQISDLKALCNIAYTMSTDSAERHVVAGIKRDQLSLAIFRAPRSGSQLLIKLDQLTYRLNKKMLPRLQ